MNLRGKGSVSMPKTPLEWANLRSAGQVPSPKRERGREKKCNSECVCMCVCRKGGNGGGWGLREDP